MSEKYRIGDFVRRDGSGEDSWFVIATRQQPLTLKYLRSREEPLMVKGIEEMARVGVFVDSDGRTGFEYIVRKILPTMENSCYLLDETDVPCFEEDIWQ